LGKGKRRPTFPAMDESLLTNFYQKKKGKKRKAWPLCSPAQKGRGKRRAGEKKGRQALSRTSHSPKKEEERKRHGKLGDCRKGGEKGKNRIKRKERDTTEKKPLVFIGADWKRKRNPHGGLGGRKKRKKIKQKEKNRHGQAWFDVRGEDGGMSSIE